MTIHQKFVDDMGVAGISTEEYLGRFFWKGPAVHSDQQNGPTLQTIIGETEVPLQWDSLNSNFVVYPVGRANAEWGDGAANSEEDDEEQDGYTEGYITTTPKDDDEED